MIWLPCFSKPISYLLFFHAGFLAMHIQTSGSLLCYSLCLDCSLPVVYGSLSSCCIFIQTSSQSRSLSQTSFVKEHTHHGHPLLPHYIFLYSTFLLLYIIVCVRGSLLPLTSNPCTNGVSFTAFCFTFFYSTFYNLM